MSDEATLAVISSLHALGIPYLVVGSLSSNYYGVPRSTRDADIVIDLGDQPVSVIAERLGSAFRLDPQPAFEGVTGTTRHLLQVVGISFTIELFRLSDDPHDRERFQRRHLVSLLGREVFLPTAEDVIITKLRWALQTGRSKDREDVRSVIAVQGDNIDWEYVHRWCEQHGTRLLLDALRASLPR